MNRLRIRWLTAVLCMVLLAAAAMLAGCEGDAGPAGTNGIDGQDLMATAKPESCAICHGSAGTAHQAVYDDYVDSDMAITIDSISTVASGTTVTSTMLVTITKNGQPYIDPGLNNTDQKRFYATRYTDATKEFGGAAGAFVISFGSPTHLGGGQYSVVASNPTFTPETSNGMAYAYVADGALATEGMTLYADVANAGAASGNVGNYASSANVSGCEKCHGAPYRKHGYRAATVSNLPDFVACKSCHLDDKDGTHQSWQLLVDDVAQYATYDLAAKAAAAIGDTAHDSVEENMTVAEKARYAYKRDVMSDVHMSHAMEFAYPQSMANCATCHSGKLGTILANTNYNLTTCRSCHPVTATAGTDAKRAPALKAIMPTANHSANILDNLYVDTADPDCITNCHDGVNAPQFNELHTGYNAVIYADTAGNKYSDAITVSIDSASFNAVTSVLTITASATGSAGGLSATDIVPEMMIGLYGYDTKDFIVNGHDRYDSNNNGIISRQDGDLPKGAYEVGTQHAYWTTVSATGGAWTVTTDLTEWSDMIADDVIRRVEIAILPILTNATGDEVALNAPSRTFDLGTNGFTTYYSPIVDVANGCNTCHDALATTFHSPDRGGNITVCRMCHVSLAGGSHLEMQSRSIDSYVHAIHSFQAFDIGDVNFGDPVEALHYEHHVESTYPNFTIKNCESCHTAGTYNVPDQAKSMPGLHSAADAVTTADRNIGAVPSYVTGPGSRACGACHRANWINEDNASELAAFNEHTNTNGYMLEETGGVLDAVIDKIMSIFK